MKLIRINLDDYETERLSTDVKTQNPSLYFWIREKLINEGIILQPPLRSKYEIEFDYFRPLDGAMEHWFESHTNTWVFKYHEPSDIYIDPNKWATEKDADPIKDILKECGRL